MQLWGSLDILFGESQIVTCLEEGVLHGRFAPFEG